MYPTARRRGFPSFSFDCKRRCPVSVSMCNSSWPPPALARLARTHDCPNGISSRDPPFATSVASASAASVPSLTARSCSTSTPSLGWVQFGLGDNLWRPRCCLFQDSTRRPSLRACFNYQLSFPRCWISSPPRYRVASVATRDPLPLRAV